MDKYANLIAAISTKNKTPFRPASPKDLQTLRTLKLPASIISFYTQYEPAVPASGQVRLWPITEILVENTQAVPGISLRPNGYIVFASTWTGNAYCFNTNKLNPEGEPEIILASHESIDEDSTPEQIHRAVKSVAKTLHDFLEQFINEKIEQ